MIERSSIKLSAVGDIMLGDHPVCVGHGVRSTLELHGFPFLGSQVCGLFDDSQIVFGNLEAVLSDVGMKREEIRSFELRGRPDESKALANCGINVLNLANNHILQHGRPVLFDTINNLTKAGIQIVGTRGKGESLPLEVTVRGLSVVFLGFSMRPERFDPGPLPYAFARKDEILRRVKEVRSDFPGQLVLSLHWGEEYLHYPARWQVDFAHALVDSGVSLLLGHHPHVLQGVEEYHGGLIAYSLGNFFFDKWQRAARDTIVLNCHLSVNGIESWEFIPVHINRSFQPVPASGVIKERIERAMHEYSEGVRKIAAGERPFDDWSVERYSRLSQRAYLRFRLQSYCYFLSHIFSYDFHTIISSIQRFLRRRLGRE